MCSNVVIVTSTVNISVVNKITPLYLYFTDLRLQNPSECTRPFFEHVNVTNILAYSSIRIIFTLHGVYSVRQFNRLSKCEFAARAVIVVHFATVRVAIAIGRFWTHLMWLRSLLIMIDWRAITSQSHTLTVTYLFNITQKISVRMLMFNKIYATLEPKQNCSHRSFGHYVGWLWKSLDLPEKLLVPNIK